MFSMFGSSPYELENFLCGIGKSSIQRHGLSITDYPFKPSVVFPSRSMHFSEIEEVHISGTMPTLKIEGDLVFISKEQESQLLDFAKRNDIRIKNRNSNWELITQPFLDTEVDGYYMKTVEAQLAKNKIPKREVEELRQEISRQMYKYNFDTMLWEWVSLGLSDVLAAMRVKYNASDFDKFYWRAIEVELRG